MLENRRHLRFRLLIDVEWSMPDQGTSGPGRIFNISSSGIQLEVNSSGPLNHSPILLKMELIEGDKVRVFNKKGKILWFYKINNPNFNYKCGVEFIDKTGLDKDFNNWIESKTTELYQTLDVHILNNYIV